MGTVFDLSPIIQLFDAISPNGVADVIRDISRRFASSSPTDLVESFTAYDDFFREFTRRIRHHGRLAEEDYAALKKLAEDSQKKLDKYSVDISPAPLPGSQRDLTLLALHYLGGIHLATRQGPATLFIGPQMLSNAILVAASHGRESLIRHIRAIAEVRGDKETEENPALAYENFVAMFAEKLQHRLADCVKAVLPLRVPGGVLDDVIVEYLPTATDFYQAGIDYYSSPSGDGRDHCIFATTSGILLPEEYHGSVFWEKILPVPEMAMQSDKNPARRHYFEALANVGNRPRYYFFEAERAGVAYRKTLKKLRKIGCETLCDRYRQHAGETLVRFLQLPGFNILGVTKLPSPFDHLTLGNDRNLIVSMRNDPSHKNKIGHGLWLRPSPQHFQRWIPDLEKLTSEMGKCAIKAALVNGPLEALSAAFGTAMAVPMFMALVRGVKAETAKDELFNLRDTVKAGVTDEEDFLVCHLPGSRALSDSAADKEARKILEMLESVPSRQKGK